MKALKIEGTATTPCIVFEPEQGRLEIKGRSVPESSVAFYRPLFESLDEYAKHPKSPIWVDVQFDYFNTSSSKSILDIFRRLEAMHDKGVQVIVNWYYENKDENMREAGEDYEAIMNFPFNVLQVELEV